MSDEVASVVSQALALSPEDRRRIVAEIIASLQGDPLKLSTEQLAEVRRLVDEGDASGIFDGDPFAHLRSKHSLPDVR